TFAKWNMKNDSIENEVYINTIPIIKLISPNITPFLRLSFFNLSARSIGFRCYYGKLLKCSKYPNLRGFPNRSFCILSSLEDFRLVNMILYYNYVILYDY